MNEIKLLAETYSGELSSILFYSFLAFFIAILLTPVYTYFAYKYKFWKKKRETHDVTGQKLKVINKLRIKRKIPRMAGVVTIVAVTIVTLLLNLDRSQTWLPVAALVGAGLVGLVDDIILIRRLIDARGGLKASVKFTLIAAIGAVGGWWFFEKLDVNSMHVPFYGDLTLGWLIIPVFIFAIVATSSAVNITDGVDGLAGGLLMSAFTAFGVIAFLQGNFGVAGFCFTINGALLAYTWFNVAPARFVMGDVGSFSLGTALGVVAMLTDTLLLLPIIGFLFVAEAGSVLLQIFSKKLFKRKIFVATPLHHHLEAARDWPKTKVTMRFWIVGQVCATFGIILAILGNHIT